MTVLLFSGAVFFGHLGRDSIANADEGVHALVTRELRESGDWLTLHLRGVNYFRKPPLSFWIRGLTQNILGENEFTDRLPSALAGVGTTLLLAWWAWLWTKRKAVCLVVGIIYPLLPSTFTHTFRTGETDGILIFLLTLTAFLLWQSLKRPWLVVAAGVTVGLSFMTKSVAAGVVPIGFIAALLIARRWPYRWKHILLAVAAFLVIVVPWHVYELKVHGSAFWKEYVEYHILQRVEERLHVTPKTHGPFWYLLGAEQGMFPWSWLVLPAGAAVALSVWKKKREDDGFSQIFLLSWGVATIALFSLAATKLAWYIAPAYPAFALLAAWFIVSVFWKSPPWLKVFTGICASAYLFRSFELYRTGIIRSLSLAFVNPRIAIGLVLLVGLALLGIAYRRSPALGARVLKVFSVLVFLHMLLVSLVIFSRNARKTYESPFRLFRNAIEARSARADVSIFDIGYYTSPLASIYLVGEHGKRNLVPLKEQRNKLNEVLEGSPGSFVIFERSRTLDAETQQRVSFVGAYGALALYQVLPK